MSTNHRSRERGPSVELRLISVAHAELDPVGISLDNSPLRAPPGPQTSGEVTPTNGAVLHRKTAMLK